MSYDSLFERYGSPHTEAEIRFYGYLTRPDQCKEKRSITHYDEEAARLIEKCKTLIDQLSDYRQALAARYAQLETMPYRDRLELERHRRYKGTVSYYIRIVRRFEDGTEIKRLSETYNGKERRKALDRFEALKKQYPGMEAIKDIEPQKWEKL